MALTQAERGSALPRDPRRRGRGRSLRAVGPALLLAGVITACSSQQNTVGAGDAGSAAPPKTPVATRDQTGGLGRTKSTAGGNRRTQAQNDSGRASASNSTSSTASSGSTSSGGGGNRQWATGATATSNYGPGSGDPWNASQATGPPDVDPECGDNGKAWASRANNTVETLTLTYGEPMVPTELRVYQTYNPGQIVQMELKGPSGQSKVVYKGEPQKPDGCPVEGYLQDLQSLGVDFPVDTVLITIDQSKLGTGWAEIDAVALIGS